MPLPNTHVLLYDSTTESLDCCKDVSQRLTIPTYFSSIGDDIERCKKGIIECCKKIQGRVHNVAPSNIHIVLYETIYPEDNAYIDKLMQTCRYDILYLVITLWLSIASHFTPSRWYYNAYRTALRRIGLTSWHHVDRRIVDAIQGEGWDQDIPNYSYVSLKRREMDTFANSYLYEIATIWNYIDTHMMHNI